MMQMNEPMMPMTYGGACQHMTKNVFLGRVDFSS